MNKYYIGGIVIFLILLLGNCTTDKRSNNTNTTQSSKYKEGFDIINQNCISCHSPKANATNGIAPSLLSIKEFYKKKNVSETQFVDEMVQFLLKPQMKNAKMSDAVQSFGLMPKLGYSEEQYEAIASYLFYAEIEKPDWLKKDKQKFSKSGNEATQDYLKKGRNLALSTKGILGKNLLNAIKTKGTTKALGFCNERAVFLTDSMSTQLNAKIKRVSDNNRNPNNMANDLELEYILQTKKEIENKVSPKPKMHEEGDKITAYYPIMTNEMCLQCHGKADSDIKSETLKEINKLYPNDKAQNYGVNELRGIWVIEMDR